jgi:hypothetical protein
MLALARRLGFRIEPHPEGGTLRRIVRDLAEDVVVGAAVLSPVTEA